MMAFSAEEHKLRGVAGGSCHSRRCINDNNWYRMPSDDCFIYERKMLAC